MDASYKSVSDDDKIFPWKDINSLLGVDRSICVVDSSKNIVDDPLLILYDFTNSFFINVKISSLSSFGNNISISFNAKLDVIIKSSPASFPVKVSSL